MTHRDEALPSTRAAAGRIDERARFNFIRYANCWEDAEILSETLRPRPMIDRELRKANHVHHGRPMAAERGHQLLRGALLLRAAERKDHSPVAALNITAPAAAAFGFQQPLLGVAERARRGRQSLSLHEQAKRASAALSVHGVRPLQPLRDRGRHRG